MKIQTQLRAQTIVHLLCEAYDKIKFTNNLSLLKEAHMKYIGLDLHKKSIFATVLGEDGKILASTRLGSKKRDIHYFLKSQGKADELSVAMEACYNWSYFYRAVEGSADNIVLAHPLKTRIIAEALDKDR